MLRGGVEEIFRASRAIVVVDDPATTLLPTAALVQEIFGLTPAEARLVLSIARGETPSEAAERLGFRTDTARKHLQSAFAKTGTRRQAELVALVMKLAR